MKGTLRLILIVIMTITLCMVTGCVKNSKEYNHKEFSTSQIADKMYKEVYSEEEIKLFVKTELSEEERRMTFGKDLASSIDEATDHSAIGESTHRFILARINNEGAASEVEDVFNKIIQNTFVYTEGEEKLKGEAIVKTKDNLVIMIFNTKTKELEEVFDKIIKGKIKIDKNDATNNSNN